MVHLGLGQALDKLRESLAGRRVVPSIPAGRVVILPPVEADERIDSPLQEIDAAVALGLFIAYTNAKGEISERRISVKQLIGVPPTMLLCFCHERKAMRHFRVDRIGDVAIAETGELIDPTHLVALLMGAGLSPLDPLLRCAVDVMVFLMRCDGRADPAEWEAIEMALAGFVMRFDGDHDQAMSLARKVAPDSSDFLRAIRAFHRDARSGSLVRWLMGAMRQVVDADGVHSADEFRWLTEVQEILSAMERVR